MAKELTDEEITALLSGVGKRAGKRDTTEPRTTDNWWNQRTHFIYRPDYSMEVKCANPRCGDPRPHDRMIVLAQIKDTLICRYCFLDGYLSNG